MGLVERKMRLLEGIARLRRVERRSAPDKDVVAVRTMLERELGETFSRRLAARLLGVDHKALARWIDSGDLPVVQTPSGRIEIPVAAVLELYEAVADSRAAGTRTRHHLEPSLTEGRRNAERMRPRELADNDAASGHGRAERRSLAYHRALAKRLRRPMVDDALRLLWQWRDQGRIDDLRIFDVAVTRPFRFKKYTFRAGIRAFNLFGASADRDVQTNTTSPSFGRFFNPIERSIGIVIGSQR